MAFLSWLGRTIIEITILKLFELAKNAYTNWKRKRQIKKEAEESAKKLKDAQTAQEIDDATDDMLDGI